MSGFFPYYSIATLCTGVVCLGQGIFIFLNNRRSKANLLYFLFCLATSLWLFSAAVLASKFVSVEYCLFWAKMIYAGVVFMPTLVVHFSIAVLKNNIPPNTRLHVKIAYVLTFLFLVLVWTSDQFITGIQDHSWGYYPNGGPLHRIHTVFVLITAGYGLSLLRLGMIREKKMHGKSRAYHENKYLFWAFLFLALASWDFLANMDVDVYPIGFVFVTIFICATTWAIFRHNLLGVTLVIKKSLVYSSLISVIATLYFLGIYLAGMFVRDHAQIRSLPVMLALLTIITLLSRPIERRISRAIDRLFYKKPIELMAEENKQLLEQIQKQDRLKAVSTFAAGMAHEIKNPLTAMKTFIEYLPKKIHEEGFLENYHRTLSREVDKIDGIVRKLLDFSKPGTPQTEPVCAATSIRETLRFMSGDFLKNNIRSEISLPDKAPAILANRKQFEQVLLNLFLNAVQAMPEGGTLSIRAWEDPARDKIFIEIRDTGSGIPGDQIKNIFDPFFTTKPAGTGLGLSVVYNIIQDHGGKIAVHSAVGQGTVFTVEWPTGIQEAPLSDRALN